MEDIVNITFIMCLVYTEINWSDRLDNVKGFTKEK